MSDFISSGFGNALEYGIDLKLDSREEEVYYVEKLCEWFNENTDYKAYLSGEASAEIEFDRKSPIMEVIIQDSTLFMLPYAEDIFEIFTLVLTFIAKKHLDVIGELREGIEIHKIESLNSFTKDKIVENDEDDDDDDYEWI